MKEFASYFSTQWLGERFNTWQIFNTPPGFASTDNPVESFNKVLKYYFTNREQLTVALFVQVILEQVIEFYSKNHRTFFFYRQPDKNCKSVASKIGDERLKLATDSIAYYTGLRSTYQINFSHNSCTCKYYLAYAMCAHLVAACRVFGKTLLCAKSTRGYVYRSKRGPKPKANPKLQYLLSATETQVYSTNAEIESSNEILVDSCADPDSCVSRKRRRENDIEENEEAQRPEKDESRPVKRGRGRPKLSDSVKKARAAERLAKGEDTRKTKCGRKPKATKALNLD